MLLIIQMRARRVYNCDMLHKVLMKSPVSFFCLLSLLACVPATAEVKRDAHTEVELISSVTAVKPGDSITVAVRLKPDPGWHIYWKNPGESGLAPEIQWTLPSGMQTTPLEWPYPHKIVANSIVTYGYEEEILLTTILSVPKSARVGESLPIAAKLSWLACEVACVPGKADLTLDIPIAESSLTDEVVSENIRLSRQKLAVTLSSWKTETSFDDKSITLTIFSNTDTQPSFKDLYFFSEHPDLLDHSKPQTVAKTSQGYLIAMPRSTISKDLPDRLSGVLVADHSWDPAISSPALRVDALLHSPGVESREAPMGFWTAVFFAFLGGVILNLMPCVLPVLSLKIFSFMKEASHNPKALLAHGFAFTAGVVLSFWMLAGLLIFLRSVGASVGWGFQLQSPTFLIILSFIFFVFSLNLFGLFEIGASLTGAGQSLSQKGGLVGSFFSGVFATVVATPCTAPFMGAALGYTLTQPVRIALGVFTALGLGMAAPYMLLCAQPKLVRWVPKPGAWMETFKKVLGIPLLATVFWLAWVLSLQKGVSAVYALGLGLVLAGVGLWIYGRWGNLAASRKSQYNAVAISTTLLFLGLFGSIQWTQKLEAPTPKDHLYGASTSISWEVYTDKRWSQLRAEKKPVFVDFTAAWCLTCQVNERVALSSPAVMEAFSKKGVMLLKADWTSQDAEITAALRRFGRNSVPLYVYDDGSGNEPVILPEIITPKIVLDTLNKKEKT